MADTISIFLLILLGAGLLVLAGLVVLLIVLFVLADRKSRPSDAPVLVGLSLGALLGSMSGYLTAAIYDWVLGEFYRVYLDELTQGIHFCAGICCGWVVGAGLGAGAGWLMRSLQQRSARPPTEKP